MKLTLERQKIGERIYTYVDSAIAHGAPQRMEISEARNALTEKISEANSHLAVLHMEEEAILSAVQMRAVIHLQKVYRAKKNERTIPRSHC